MTVIFVHGVPETARIWDPLIAELDLAEAVALKLPGFGSDLPDGFAPNKENYGAWLLDEIAPLEEVHLVGHDWGALLVTGILATQPSNVASWVIDTGDLNQDFKWHATAKIWQTPGEGEAFMESWLAATPEERAAGLMTMGAPAEGAQWMGEDADATMGQAILGLYRSAVNVAEEWGPGIDSWNLPGLLIGSANDPFRKPRFTQSLAKRTGAKVLDLPDAGHWWMLEMPEVVAPALREFLGM